MSTYLVSKNSTSIGFLKGTYVNNVSLALADDFKVPLPDFCCNGLTDGTQNSEVLHFASHMLVSSTLEQTQCCGGHVELSDLVFVDDIPVAGEVGIGRSAFKDNGGNTEQQGSIHDV